MKLTTKMMVLSGATLAIVAGANAQTDLDHGRAYAADLMSDASGRTSLLAAPDAATPEIGGWVTFRYMFNNADQGGGTAEDNTVGFQTRYTKVFIKGELNANWSYFVQANFDRSGGDFTLDDAWGKYRFDQGWAVRWGQFKAPFSREELVSDNKQLAFDRSNVNSFFSAMRTQGVEFGYDADQFRFRGMINDGARQNNTDFTDENSDFAITGRFEYKGAGDWKQFDDFTSWQGSPFAWLIGGAVHFQSGGSTFQTGTGATRDATTILYTIDGSLEGNGWNAFASFIGVHDDADGQSDTDDFGFLIQGGFFVAPQNELWARYDVSIPDDDSPGDDNFSTISLGWNHYFIPESHAAKFTLGGSLFLDDPTESSTAIPSTGTGLLSAADDGQFVIVAQMQLLF